MHDYVNHSDAMLPGTLHFSLFLHLSLQKCQYLNYIPTAAHKESPPMPSVSLQQSTSTEMNETRLSDVQKYNLRSEQIYFNFKKQDSEDEDITDDSSSEDLYFDSVEV